MPMIFPWPITQQTRAVRFTPLRTWSSWWQSQLKPTSSAKPWWRDAESHKPPRIRGRNQENMTNPGKSLISRELYVCMYVCMHACMYVCIYVCIYVCMHACMYVCMYVLIELIYADMYIWYVYIYVCVCWSISVANSLRFGSQLQARSFGLATHQSVRIRCR